MAIEGSAQLDANATQQSDADITRDLNAGLLAKFGSIYFDENYIEEEYFSNTLLAVTSIVARNFSARLDTRASLSAEPSYANVTVNADITSKSKANTRLSTEVSVDFSKVGFTLPIDDNITVEMPKGFFVEDYKGSNQSPIPADNNLFSFQIPVGRFKTVATLDASLLVFKHIVLESVTELTASLLVFKHIVLESLFALSVPGARIRGVNSQPTSNASLSSDGNILKLIEKMNKTVSTTRTLYQGYAQTINVSSSYYAIGTKFYNLNGDFDIDPAFEIYSKSTDNVLGTYVANSQVTGDATDNHLRGSNIAFTDTILAFGNTEQNVLYYMDVSKFTQGTLEQNVTEEVAFQAPSINSDNGPNPNLFGLSVATNDNVVACSSYENDRVKREGVVYVYDASFSQNYSSTSQNYIYKISNPNSSPPDNARFGKSIAIANGKILVAEELAGQAHLFDLSDGSFLQTFQAGKSSCYSVGLTSTYAILGSEGIGQEGLVEIFDISTGNEVRSVAGSQTGATHFGEHFDYNNDYLVVMFEKPNDSTVYFTFIDYANNYEFYTYTNGTRLPSAIGLINDTIVQGSSADNDDKALFYKINLKK